MTDERTRVLQMVRDGAVSVEEADRLLRALESSGAHAAPARARVLRVRASSRRGEHLDVALPLALVDLVMKLLPSHARLMLDRHELDVRRLVAEVRDGQARGTIVDVRDPRGDHIEIIAE